MAPQKGGQATKQQKQQQSVGTGVAKKPASQGATAVRPAVVPAIPLPMMQRPARTKGSANSTHLVNKTKQPAPAAVPSNAYPVASLEAALIDQQAAAAADDSAMSRRKQKPSKQNEVNTNGTHVEKPGSTATAAINGRRSSDKKQHNRQHPTSNSIDNPAATQGVTANNSIHALSNGVGQVTFGDNLDNPTAPSSSASVLPSTAPSVVGGVNGAEGSDLVNERQNGNLVAPHQQYPSHCRYVPEDLLLLDSGHVPDRASTQVSRPEAAVTPDSTTPEHFRRDYDGSFDPAVNNTNFHAQQQARSNGAGITFGGAPTPDSHTPPPASGAFMTPSARSLLNGVNGDNHKLVTTDARPFHNGRTESNGNNFAAPITPFRPGHEHLTSMDSYGPVPASASVHRLPLDGYNPNGAQYEPLTPHSFHGSHASGDYNGLDNVTSFRPNGHGFDQDHRIGRPHSGPPMQPFPAHQQFPRRSSVEEELLDSVIFFQNQFNSAELADCTLELKYPDGFSHPVKINAHKLILARSPALKHYIMIARAADPGSHVITVNATDRYLRSDAWFTAVQRLYLHPLFSPPPTANGSEFAGTNIDQFRFCLGYAAAGHLLEMADVLTRGLQIAAAMIYWHTVEEALGFAFEGAVQRHFIGDDGHDYLNVEFAYGRDTRILMGSITSFLINYFPPNFELDTTVVDPPMFARIPSAAFAHVSFTKSAPAIARGTSIRKPSKSNRLSVIKFGDLPTAFPEEEAGAAPREPAKCSSLLSRILLNLPFEDLRYVMTSDQSSPQAWNTAQDRYHALADIIAEREARRLRAVDAVRARVIPGHKEIQQRLSALRRHNVVDAWDVLNWQEEVVQSSGAGGLNLIRKWVPQFDVPQEITTEQPYERNSQESMV